MQRAVSHCWHDRPHKSVIQLVTAVGRGNTEHFMFYQLTFWSYLQPPTSLLLSTVLKANLIATWEGPIFLIMNQRLKDKKHDKIPTSFNTNIVSEQGNITTNKEEYMPAQTTPTVWTRLYLYWSAFDLQTPLLKRRLQWGYLFLWQ